MGITVKISVAVLRQEVLLLLLLTLRLPRRRLLLFQLFLLLFGEVVDTDVVPFWLLYVGQLLACFAFLSVGRFRREFFAVLYFLFPHLLHIRPFLLGLLAFTFPLLHFRLRLPHFFVLLQLFTVFSRPRLSLLLRSLISRPIFVDPTVIPFSGNFHHYLNLRLIPKVSQSGADSFYFLTCIVSCIKE